MVRATSSEIQPPLVNHTATTDIYTLSPHDALPIPHWAQQVPTWLKQWVDTDADAQTLAAALTAKPWLVRATACIALGEIGPAAAETLCRAWNRAG